MSQPLYRFQEIEPLIPLPRDVDTPDAPGCDDPDPVYGCVVRKWGNVRLRVKGFQHPLWSVWAGPALIHTTKDLQNIRRFIQK